MNPKEKKALFWAKAHKRWGKIQRYKEVMPGVWLKV